MSGQSWLSSQRCDWYQTEWTWCDPGELCLRYSLCNCEPFVMGDLKWCNLLWGVDHLWQRYLVQLVVNCVASLVDKAFSLGEQGICTGKQIAECLWGVGKDINAASDCRSMRFWMYGICAFVPFVWSQGRSSCGIRQSFLHQGASQGAQTRGFCFSSFHEVGCQKHFSIGFQFPSEQPWGWAEFLFLLPTYEQLANSHLFGLCSAAHYQSWSTTLFLFLCFHLVFNNSSLFMSMNLISIIINIMDMKRHMLIVFFIFM
jgi:hypothetical protein